MSVSIPPGTRDFSPEEMAKRNYIFDTIRGVYKLFAYHPIETPAMEKLSTLMGKYGEEGDKLLFKILNSGNFLEKVPNETIENRDIVVLLRHVSDKGLRYDLTVPFARYVVQHRNEIIFPFKRYQIQPVWRADRPQKGRYREFFQCDADVIGSTSLLNEAELIQIVDIVFTRFGFDVEIKLNNRKVLSGIAEIMGQADKLTDITVAIDKIEKIGLEAVKLELFAKGITAEQFSLLHPILKLSGNNIEKLDQLEVLLNGSEVGTLGINELRTILKYTASLGIKQEISIDLSLARGLNYYTGAIIEVKAKGVEMGSICGGGRYDNLTGIFGLKDVSGVGISFGADRIYDVLNILNLYPKDNAISTKVLFVNMGDKEELYCLEAMTFLRNEGIAVEIYPDRTKLKKQLDYANKRNLQYVVIVGEDELSNKTFTLKDMYNKEQFSFNLEQLIEKVR